MTHSPALPRVLACIFTTLTVGIDPRRSHPAVGTALGVETPRPRPHVGARAV
jgi:hypothetical protein